MLEKTYYGLIDGAENNGNCSITKLDFLKAYSKTREDTFKESTVTSGFAADGLVPLNPECVISKLDIQIRPSTPPPNPETPSIEQNEHLVLRTPRTYKELKARETLIDEFYKDESRTPTNLEKTAIKQVFKSVHSLGHKTAFLEKELRDLRAELANQEQKLKREKRKRGML